MSIQRRISGIHLFLGVLLAALTVFGCSGSGDDPLPIGPGSYGSISGTLTASSTIASARDVEASILAATNFANTLVYLEKYPQIATHPSSSGIFTLSPVTYERHNVIARLTGTTGAIYKVRSSNIDVSTSQPAKQVGSLEVRRADRKVKVRVSDSTGGTISTATVSVWGELFTPVTGLPGYYESPVLPADEAATVTVAVSGRTTIELPAQFVSTTPPVLETTVPPAGSTNAPPVVALSADKLQVSNSATITFTATARDPENSTLRYHWEASSGSIATSSDVRAIWTAPVSGNGDTAVTFIASDSSGLYARVTLTVSYGVSASQNQKPVVAILADSSTMIKNTAYTLTASATDPDGAASGLSYAWRTTNGTLSSSNAKETVWTTPTVNSDTSVTVTVTVTDEKSGSTEVSRTFTVIPYGTRIPTASITKPTENQVLAAGAVQFIGTVRLSDGSGLSTDYYHWYVQPIGGSPSEVASQTGNFTRIMNTPGSYTAWLMATTTEGLGTSASMPFRINTAPQSVSITVFPDQSSFAASTTITLSGGATDPENQALSYAWFDYSHMLNATTTLSTSQTVPNYRNFAPGNHTITLVVGDTFNASTPAYISFSIATNTAPAPVITAPLSTKTWCFTGEPVTFAGYATDLETADGFVASTSLSWTSDPNTPFPMLGTTTFTTSFTQAQVGTHVITLQASDTLLASATVSRSIYVNATPTVQMKDVDNPASGTRVNNGGTFTLKAEIADADNNEPVTIEWYDENTGVRLNSSSLTGPYPKTHTLTSSLTLSDNHVIQARVIDSCGITAIATRSLLINTLATPGMTINYPQYATAPGNIPVLLASVATQIDLNAWATDFEAGGGQLSAGHISCTLTGPGINTPFASGTVSLPLNLDPGKYQVMVGVLDDSGSYNAATFTFVVWSVRTYLGYGAGNSQLSSPSTILLDGSSYFITDSGNSMLKKFTSAAFTPEASVGGLGSDPGSFTSLVGIAKDSSGKFYTLEGLPSMAFSRIQVWSSGLATESNYGSFGVGGLDLARYSSPAAMTIVGTDLFLCDTGAHRIQRLNLASGVANMLIPTSGTAPGNDSTHFNTPMGIRYFNPALFVADYNNDRIVKRNVPSLGYSSEWPASNPVDIAQFNSYYITVNMDGDQIQFWNSSGGWEMNAGSDGAGLGQFDTPVSVVVNGQNLVVLERGTARNQARVHVFTLPAGSSPW